MHHPSELPDARTKRFQLVFANAIVLRISGLHVSILELLKPGAITVEFARPDVDESTVNALCLDTKKAEIMYVRGVKRRYQ